LLPQGFADSNFQVRILKKTLSLVHGSNCRRLSKDFYQTELGLQKKPDNSLILQFDPSYLDTLTARVGFFVFLSLYLSFALALALAHAHARTRACSLTLSLARSLTHLSLCLSCFVAYSFAHSLSLSCPATSAVDQGIQGWIAKGRSRSVRHNHRIDAQVQETCRPAGLCAYVYLCVLRHLCVLGHVCGCVEIGVRVCVCVCARVCVTV